MGGVTAGLAKNDINSTEKLLRVIRGEEPAPEAKAAPPSKSSKPLKPPKPPKREPKRPAAKGTVLGVDIGYEELRLIRMTARRQLVDVVTEPYEKGVRRNSPGFPQFLRTVLGRHIGSGRRVDIWAAVPSSGLELRYLRIPKVPRPQVANAVQWTFRKENPYNEKENLFDFEILGEVTDEGARKLEVLAYIVPKTEVDELTELFQKAGHPLAGITAIPFAVQNMFRTNWLSIPEGDACNLYIGRNWSRIDLFSGGTIRLSRGVKAGMFSMVDSLRDRVEERTKDDTPEGLFADFDFKDSGVFELVTPKPLPEKEAAEGDPVMDLFNRLIDGGSFPVELDSGVRFREHEVFDMLLPALDRLVRQLERTLDHYYQKLKGQRVSRVFLSGRVAGYPRLASYISQQLDTPVELLDPLLESGPGLPNQMSARNMSVQERAAFTPALGLSLSDNLHTPNAIVTWRDKERISRGKRLHQGLVIGFCVVMLILGGFYHVQGLKLKGKQNHALALNVQMQNFVPQANQDLILAAVARMIINQDKYSLFGDRYRAVAIMSELAEMTPATVRLTHVTADMGPAKGPENKDQEKKDDAKKAEKDEPPKTKVLVEGVIRGERPQLESTLAQYLLRLQMSPLFGQPAVMEQRMMNLAEEEVLFFKAEVEVI
jgi:type IV pilus assembly protein PilM